MVLSPLKQGDIIEGKIVGLGKSAIFLDLGPKGTGIIYGQEFYDAKGLLKDLKIGERIFAKVVEVDNEEGYIELSLQQAQKELIWKDLAEKKEKGSPIKTKILGANKGGLLAEIRGIPAFLPVSHLLPQHYPRVEGGDKLKILRELQKLIGQELETKIIGLDQHQQKIILSEKVRGAQELKAALQNYQVGDVVEGVITSLADFGAFISFPLSTGAKSPALNPSLETSSNPWLPIEGLIHISELARTSEKEPPQIVKIGQIVQAKIIEIADNKVALSLKALKTGKKTNEAPN